MSRSSSSRPTRIPFLAWIVVGGALVGGDAAWAAEAPGRVESGHIDPFSFVLLELAVLVSIAMLGRWAAGRLKQPAVLGELLTGVVVGNVGYWLGWPVFVLIMHLGDVGTVLDEVWTSGKAVADAMHGVFPASAFDPGGVGRKLLAALDGPDARRLIPMGFAAWIFSNLGVVLLLFMVGLESSVSEMRQVGLRAALVAVIGVAAPFLLGLGMGEWMLPELGLPAHLFLAATFCATSVGITARVFKDLDRIQTPEAKVILGAAVIDDVLGLIILAVVVGVVSTGEIAIGHVLRISGLSALFLALVVALGERLVRSLAPVFESLDRNHGRLLFPLGLAFLLSWMANRIGLASIVGAFAAGLILSEEYFERRPDQRFGMADLVAPLEAIFAPVFFVLMGAQVNLATFGDPATVGIALVGTAVAVLGKLVAGFAAERGMDRVSVGIGMVPRGEVGLIFASIGKGIGVVDDAIFSAIVTIVMATTLITPLALRWSLFRSRPTPARGGGMP